MLPRALLAASTCTRSGVLVPNYLTERDYPWLRAVLDEHARYVGCKRADFAARMREPLPVRAPRAALAAACHVLEAVGRDRVGSVVPPMLARQMVFRAAVARPHTRTEVLARAASSFGVGVADVEAALFADLKGERRVGALPSTLDPAQLALEANHWIVNGLLRRSARVRIRGWGNTRALVRQARLAGLICQITETRRAVGLHDPSSLALDGAQALVESAYAALGVELDISGPFTLFRHTAVYGRALGALLGRLAWCGDYELHAECVLGRGSDTTRLIVRAGDPIIPARELSRYDSKLEKRFDREFRKAAPDWDVVREPAPLAAGERMIFPDFELVHRRDARQRWLLEIVGFWTPEYLSQKLANLRAAQLDRLVLCVDERRACVDSELPTDARVIRYRNRIDPLEVLRAIDPAHP